MTPLEEIIRTEINESGSMGVDRYMELCLSHPTHGYYMSRDPFGVTGDFITAPEISQMFGEMVGIWLVQMWRDLGAPKTFNLVELGPGRGTLMADVLRVGRSVDGFLDAAMIGLVETSPILQKSQAETLIEYEVSWVEGAEASNDEPVFFVANEFFDALPIKQFQKIGDIWMERVVQWKTGLSFGLAKTAETNLSNELPDGAIVEKSNVAKSLIEIISNRINHNGGAALIFDYGEASGLGDTLQAVKSHQPQNSLERPGEADLTAHVNFGDLASAIGDCADYLTTQGQFLIGMGMDQRAEMLSKGKDKAIVDKVKSAFHRLTDEAEMGTLFKAMAITKHGAPVPPGF